MTKQEFRQAVLQSAINDLGKGEEGENNWGPFVKDALEYVGLEIPASWCAAVVVKWITEAFRTDKFDDIAETVPVSEIYSRSAKVMFNACRRFGWLVTTPQPGDLIFFKRPGESWYAHVGVVESIYNYNESFVIVKTIEGNKGVYPAKVQRYDYRLPIDNLLGYARLLGE